MKSVCAVARSQARDAHRHMTMVFFAVLALANALAGPAVAGARMRAPARVPSAAARPTRTAHTAAAPRPAPIIHRPASLPPPGQAQPVPLVIALHASGGTPAGYEAQSGWDAVADQNGFVVAYLGSAIPSWKDPSNVDYISSMITQIEQSQNIDRRRVFVTGFSAGGYGTWLVGCRLAAQVAAIAPVSGGFHLQPCRLQRPISVLQILGDHDIIPLSPAGRAPSAGEVSAYWRKLDECPANPARDLTVGPVEEQTWTGCADGQKVGFYLIRGGGHTYPGAPGVSPQSADGIFQATPAIWSFFSQITGASLGTPSVTVAKVVVSATSVRVDLKAGESATVNAVLTGGAHRLASARRRFTRPNGHDVLSLKLPVGLAAGRYTIKLRVDDAYGRRATLTAHAKIG